MKGKGILLDLSAIDLVINARRDPSGKIISGLVIGDVTRQNAALIINMESGELKTTPALGVGISSMVNSHNALLFKHRIREQLESDGLQVSYLKVTTTINNQAEILINANY